MIKEIRNLRTLIFSALVAALITISSSAAYAVCDVPGTDGLTFHWKLDETSGTTAVDSVGASNGTMQGGLDAGVDSVSGTLDTALNFTPQDRIDLGDIDLANTFTISVWFNADTLGGGWESILMNANNYGIEVRGNDIHMRAGDKWSNDVTTDTLVTGTWYHAVMTYDLSTEIITGYLNGVSIGTNNDTTFTNNNATTYIGAWTATSENFDGIIDDVRIYNRVLSADEVLATYLQRSNDAVTEGSVVFNTSNAQLVYCDGTDWRMMGIGSYNPHAAYFNNSGSPTIVREPIGNLNVPATATKWTGSGWFRRSGNNNGIGEQIFRGTSNRTGVRFNTSNELNVRVENTSSTDVFNADSSVATTDTDWHHFLFSFDLDDNTKKHLYIDGVDVYSENVFTAGQSFDITGSSHIGLSNSGASLNHFDGDLADLWLDFETYIDFSIEDNRRKFISGANMPMYLGVDGTIPTGSKPDFFFSGDEVTFISNRGTAGGMTLDSGTIVYSSAQPGEDIINVTPNGYFVLIGNQPTNAEANEYDGDMGGLTGANAECLSFLQTYPWLGKDTAQTNELLTSTNVQAWLCDESTCQDMLPNTTYNFATAQVGKSADGGASFTTDANGFYPSADSNQWDGTTYFDRFTYYHTGRTTANTPQTGNTCNSWTDNTSGNTSRKGRSTSSNTARWSDLDQTCDLFDQYICFVNPLPPPAGMLRYSSNYNTMEYNNGAEWVAMGPIGGSPRTTNLIGHWELNETSGTTAADSTANANDGTLQSMNVPNVWTDGKASGGLRFESGSDDYVDIGDNTEFNVTLPVTITGWVNPENFNEFITIFYSDYSTANYRGYACFLSSDAGGNLLIARFGDGTGLNSGARREWEGSYSGLINIGEWAHVACVMRGPNDADIYINGVEIGGTDDGTATTMITSGSAPAVINANDFNSAAGNEHYGAAIIDDVRVYDASLSAEDIFQIYAWGLGGGTQIGTGSCSSPARAEGVMLYNSDENIMQYCNGEAWIGIGK